MNFDLTKIERLKREVEKHGFTVEKKELGGYVYVTIKYGVITVLHESCTLESYEKTLNLLYRLIKNNMIKTGD